MRIHEKKFLNKIFLQLLGSSSSLFSAIHATDTTFSSFAVSKTLTPEASGVKVFDTANEEKVVSVAWIAENNEEDDPSN